MATCQCTISVHLIILLASMFLMVECRQYFFIIYSKVLLLINHS